VKGCSIRSVVQYLSRDTSYLSASEASKCKFASELRCPHVSAYDDGRYRYLTAAALVQDQPVTVATKKSSNHRFSTSRQIKQAPHFSGGSVNLKDTHDSALAQHTATVDSPQQAFLVFLFQPQK
jgi:hypothetical protein